MEEHSMDLNVIILAAGKGTRMKSDLPKVLNPLDGRPMVSHVIENARQAGVRDIAVVIGYKGDMVKEAVGDGVSCYTQKEQLGTADAVKSASAFFEGTSTPVLILLGDAPLLSSKCIKDLFDHYTVNGADLCVLTASVKDPAAYGRIKRDSEGNFIGIVEKADASDEELKIREINSGAMLFSPEALTYSLDRIQNNNTKGEYYLTDAVTILLAGGKRVLAYDCGDENAVAGANTREELAALEEIYQSMKSSTQKN